MAEEKTRAELSGELSDEKRKNTALEERLARLEAAFSAKPAEPDLLTLAKLKDAQDELAKLRPASARVLSLPKGQQPEFVPYRGLARAKQDCTYDGYHRGPAFGLDERGNQKVVTEGEVFEVNLPVFWSDNPFEPVREVRNPDGSVRYESRVDVVIIDYRWRLKSQAIEELQARAV